MTTETYKFKQGDIVDFDLGKLKGRGRVCGIASNGVALLGVTYILELVNADGPVDYNYSHLPCFECNMKIVQEQTGIKKDKTLDCLVKSGAIKSYKLVGVDSDGVEGQESEHRNSERLYVTFNNGESLIVDTFCSGCLENTILNFDKLLPPAARPNLEK